MDGNSPAPTSRRSRVHLSRSIPLTEHFTHTQTGLLSGLLNPAVQSVYPTSSSSRKSHRVAATLSRSGCRIEVNRSTAARVEDHKRALDDNNGESDGNLPSLEERTALRPKILTEASKTGGPPFSAWNSQLFTGLGCKLTEHN